VAAAAPPTTPRDKWRPRLGLVVLAILLMVLALPFAGLFFFRLYENQLIRQTEAELIAQGAVIAATFARDVEAAGVPAEKLGAQATADITPRERYDDPVNPIEPKLDLAVDPILMPRPDPIPSQADPLFAALGVGFSEIMTTTQRSTLAGFRLLDPRGVVIAGGNDIGTSYADVEEVRIALRGRYASVLRTRISDEPPPPLYSVSRGTKVRIFVAMPVVVDGRVAGAVYLSRTPNNIVKHLHGERGKLALAILAMLLGALVIGLVFLRTISRPMHELMDRTARIAGGDASAIRPLSHHGTREMAELATAFLDMARKLQARSDTIRTFATHVSHELKSPLTAIHGAAELLRDSGEDMDAATRSRFAGNIVADTERLNGLVRRLIELARAEATVHGSESTSIAEALAALPADARVTVVAGEGADIRFRMSVENAGIILANLIDNSARHGAASMMVSASGGELVTVSVGDDGPGISAGNRARIFEPFFTTRRESGGTGMGLGIVAAIVKAHEGEVRLADSQSGVRFDITLPAAPGSS
jgi:signal transduction histidine kinase